MPVYFCPQCFTQIEPNIRICPNCGTDIVRYLNETPYPERLIHALRHPESEARMAAVIGLGRLAYAPATQPLLDSLMAWPADVVQGEQAIDSLVRIGTPNARQGLTLITDTHPSSVIRHLAAEWRAKLTE
ncbi:MAG: HEAT repeat domain-containing protein [Halothiobacillus sp.]|uniref:HEAT repeat domain-containing protein n=1 Tax=Halothiobacillus sp. TaxID=1891311 RepID=UPI002AD34C92|nr:HEAT repeat domain-containing protein [Halothiobacillus sp.]MDA3876936.1 HEAT repeat domain-containing protein [Halothiobacillus sp.]